MFNNSIPFFLFFSTFLVNFDFYSIRLIFAAHHFASFFGRFDARRQLADIFIDLAELPHGEAAAAIESQHIDVLLEMQVLNPDFFISLDK